MTTLREKMLLPVVYALSVFLGIGAAGFQLAILSVSIDFNMSGSMMGVIVAIQFLAVMAAPLLFGRLSDKYGKKRMLLIFMPVTVAGCLVSALSQNALVFMAGIFVVGAGESVNESVSSAALADADPEKADKYLNLAQFFYCAGAVIGPVLAQFLMDALGADWRVVFVMSIAAFTLLYPFMLATRFYVHPINAPAAQESRKGMLKLLGTWGFLALFVALAMYVGGEGGVAYYADSLFVKVFDRVDLGAYAISAYWLAMGVSRLIFGVVRVNASRTILVCQTAFFVSIVITALSPSDSFALVMCAVTGFAAGPTWPLIVSAAARQCPGQSGQSTSLMQVAGGLGGAVAPVVMGAVGDRSSIRGAFLAAAAFALVSLVAFALGRRKNDYN